MMDMEPRSGATPRPRLVHERTVVVCRDAGSYEGQLAVPSNDEFVVLGNKGRFHVHDIATGRRKLVFRHPEVAESYHTGINKPGRITVGCMITRDGKYYMMKDFVNVQPNTVLDVNPIHGLKDIRCRFVNYRTGETEIDVDLAAHELGQHTSGGYKETEVSFTRNYAFVVGPVPPEGRLASIDARTGKVHKVGPALEWGYPHPHTPPVFMGIGGDWVLVGRRAPFLWNARTGETGVSLDVAAARAWHDAHPTGGWFDLYGGCLAGPGVPGAGGGQGAGDGDGNDLRGRFIISGGHVFDAATGAWVGYAEKGNARWYTRDPGDVVEGKHGGLLLYAWACDNQPWFTIGNGRRVYHRNVPRAFLYGFDPATRSGVSLGEAGVDIAMPAGVPPGLVKETRYSPTAEAWTPDGSRFVVAAETAVTLDCWPTVAAWARQHPSHPAYARFVLDNELRHGLLHAGGDRDGGDTGADGEASDDGYGEDGRDGCGSDNGSGDNVIVDDLVAIKDAAEAWARSGFIAVGDPAAPGGQRLVKGSGPSGELDLRDVRDVLGIDARRVVAALARVGVEPGSLEWLRARRAERAERSEREARAGRQWRPGRPGHAGREIQRTAGAGAGADAAWREQVDVLAAGWDVHRIQVDIFKIIFD